MLEDISTLDLAERLEGRVRRHSTIVLGVRLAGYVRGHQYPSLRGEALELC